jgi:hypothetical protein
VPPDAEDRGADRWGSIRLLIMDLLAPEPKIVPSAPASKCTLPGDRSTAR